jgi:hypothetical protein
VTTYQADVQLMLPASEREGLRIESSIALLDEQTLAEKTLRLTPTTYRTIEVAVHYGADVINVQGAMSIPARRFISMS